MGGFRGFLDKLQQDYHIRHREFLEMMEMGRTVIAVLPKSDYVGTAPSFFGLLGIPIATDGTGTRIKFQGNSIFREFFESNRENFEFRATFEPRLERLSCSWKTAPGLWRLISLLRRGTYYSFQV